MNINAVTGTGTGTGTVSAEFETLPDIVCGKTYRNAESEELAVASRCEAEALYIGCDKPIQWLFAYRCRQCGRWMPDP